MKRILIIEDDESIAEVERDYLEMSGYAAEICPDGISGLARYNEGGIDLVILDLMIPGQDGFSVLDKISVNKNIPVIIVSARDEEYSKIKGLTAGADDYMTKPFSMGELVARVRRHLKTYERLSEGIKNEDILSVRDLSVNAAERRVYLEGIEVNLKQKEFDLLLFMMKNSGRVFSKEHLFERVWGYDALSDASTVTVHIARIREKIEKNPAKPEYIVTVWGAGYRFQK